HLVPSFFHCYCVHCYLPSFPTRRSSDLLGVTLERGWRVEINLRAVEWIREAARRLHRGFIVLIDYGHEARELYSPTHAGGTLTTDRKSTRLNSSHRTISYAVFCLKKKST